MFVLDTISLSLSLSLSPLPSSPFPPPKGQMLGTFEEEEEVEWPLLTRQMSPWGVE